MERMVLTPAPRTLSRIFCDGFRRRHAFDFEFRPQDQAMLQHRHGHGFHVVRRDEIAACERGVGAAGEHQRLRGARTGAHQNAFVGPRAAHDIDDVGGDFIAHRYIGQRLARARPARRGRAPRARRRASSVASGAFAPSMRCARAPIRPRAPARPSGIFSRKRSFCASGSG